MSNPYEFVRYHGKPYPQTHPERLATLATLYGLDPPGIYGARVLEIGCCDGGNLIPMAMSLPGSEFVGIDITESDIADACQTVAALGFSNIEFHVMDLTDLPGSLGQFDYIVTHGVYSWLPPDVREKLMAVIRASLSPRGVAFVSYNAQPGGHVRQAVREMMLFHIGDVQDPQEKLIRARQFLEFLSAAYARGTQSKILTKYVNLLMRQSDHVLFHDDLADHYEPVYLHEFAEHAGRYGLQYLSESSYFLNRPENLGSEAAPMFAQQSAAFGGDPVLTDQYMDFMRGAQFHQALLCHRDAPVNRTVPPDRMKRFRFLSASTVVAANPAANVGAESGEETYEGVQGSRITTGAPSVVQLMRSLIDAYPHSIPYADLPGAGISTEELCGTLLALMNFGLISATLHSPEFRLTPSEHPTVSPLTRWQAANSRTLTDLRHSRTGVETDLQLALIPLLDGTRTRESLAELFPDTMIDDALNVIGSRCLFTA